MLDWEQIGEHHWFAPYKGYTLHIEVHHGIGAPRGVFSVALVLGSMDSLERAMAFAENFVSDDQLTLPDFAIGDQKWAVGHLPRTP